MGMTAKSSTSILLPISGLWIIEFEITDADGYSASVTPAVTVTLPAGTASPVVAEGIGAGRYRAAYTVGSSGRYVARVVATGYGALDFAAYAAATTAETGMPTTDDVAVYLREGAASWDTADLQDALDAEAAAQRSICRVGAVYPADLRQALLRRVQRNLAMRQLPLAVQMWDAEGGGGTVLPGRDPEVRRFEAPYRKLVIG
ncbi:hypothetical protein [Micromonospora chalcea]|uniref:hypothetical protein n=1 Tax=Micromonospora chalcea TaxID=1874 RepID=UPI0038F75344